MVGNNGKHHLDDDLEENLGEEEFIVEKIVDRRVRNGRIEYFLKWKGFSETENTWEPETNLDCPDLISDYENRAAQKGRYSSGINVLQQHDHQLSLKRKSSDDSSNHSLPTYGSTSSGKRLRNDNNNNSRIGKTSITSLQGTNDETLASAFDRGLEPEKILGATDACGELMLLMQWKGTGEADLVPARICNTRCPQIVIRFYEERLTWINPSDMNENNSSINQGTSTAGINVLKSIYNMAPVHVTTTSSGQHGNRLERESKKHDRRSDLVCRVRYTNVLPDLPFDPKFLRYPFNPDRFVRYKPTSLEKNYRWELLTEHDVGVEIDLINPDAYASTSTGVLHADDEKLLEEDNVSPANTKRSQLNQRSVPWLRKTEYISTEQSRASLKFDKAENRSSSVKEKVREDSLKLLTKDGIIHMIEEGFDVVKNPIEKHYSKPSVVKVEEWPVFPDFDLWRYPCAQVIFDGDPSRKDVNNPQEQVEEMSQAVIKALVDNENKEYIGYFLPTEETRRKRQFVEDDDNQTEATTYDFKLIREYNWNRKDKSMSGYEENYFLVIKDDGVYYNELETRVRLSKRRLMGAPKTSNLRLLQRYRPFQENELKQQKKRLKALDNDEHALDEEEEEELIDNEEHEEEMVDDEIEQESSPIRKKNSGKTSENDDDEQPDETQENDNQDEQDDEIDEDDEEIKNDDEDDEDE
ncbi:unnamed protein product [Didymodactylos carnosus]|uniref:Heterochromatin protein 1 n=1 Tax=Didymodactylos carnosus TaxID=1234261 RepID=A0A814A047_9BILA|nr:unnamed protein product [Didymodactylos carnosus]CAF1161956.1 unnamed protein product [Didymodactylos carnosus]CAF3687530.1 unnamed protein product [Didymodactylos carnosus]CAF3973639.1 unnamed protein product [Didymodactylos carnosus]